ncbi:unnamed protein product [Zymoseptoria tritici ST99CH_1A5]|uniref:Uncharacterized protein n=1 Tax=Zymoseptoria tritici ST99CH_1A5 TaxID=1276529 RepID=A0A1Y6M3X0_ZYMTR|nr:unnamed protein product [Zymoseptoria tritici ST99CH_1A5]
MSSAIDRAFAQLYNEASDHYDNDELEECAAKAREIIDDRGTPRYHRMRALILLGNVLGDWEEANDCFVRAQALWRIIRRWQPVGQDAEADAALDELRVCLDQLEGALAEDRPPDDDSDAAVDATADSHEDELRATDHAMAVRPKAALASEQATGSGALNPTVEVIAEGESEDIAVAKVTHPAIAQEQKMQEQKQGEGSDEMEMDNNAPANIFDDIYANNELTPDKLDKIKSRFMIGKQASMENLQRPTLASKATSVRGDPRKAK